MLSSHGAPGCCSHCTGRATRRIQGCRGSLPTLFAAAAAAGLPEGQALAVSEHLGPQPAQPPPTLLPLPSLREAKLGRLSVGAADRSANPSRTCERIPERRDPSAVALSNNTLPEVGSWWSFSSTSQCKHYADRSRLPCAVPAS